MSLSAAIAKMQRTIEKVRTTSRSKKSQRFRKSAKRRMAPKPPRADAPVEQLVERVRAGLPEVFGPTPTVLELFGPWDFGTPAGRVVVPPGEPLDDVAWASRGTDLSLCDGEPGIARKTRRRPGRPLAHLGADTTTGLER